MRNNDISNNVAPAVVFDIDSLLFVNDSERTGFWEKLFPGKKIKKAFNRDTLSVLDYVWRKHDVALYLVSFTLDEEELNDVYDRLSDEGIAVSNLVHHQEWDDVLYRLNNGRYLYFFSSNEDIVNYLGKNAYLISRYREVL